MLIQIVLHTPAWVWALLTALVAIGLAQTRDREMSATRVTVLPLVLVALSLVGVLTAFRHFPIAIGGWAGGLGLALTSAATWSPPAARAGWPARRLSACPAAGCRWR